MGEVPSTAFLFVTQNQTTAQWGETAREDPSQATHSTGFLTGWRGEEMAQDLVSGGVATKGVGWSFQAAFPAGSLGLFPSWHGHLRSTAFPALCGWTPRPFLEPMTYAQATCQWDERWIQGEGLPCGQSEVEYKTILKKELRGWVVSVTKERTWGLWAK